MKLNKTTLIIIIAAIVVVALAVTLICVLPKNGNNNGGENPPVGPEDPEDPEDPADPADPVEKTYTLSLVVDEGLNSVSKGGATVIALAIVFDADGKIVAARFDSVQPKFALNEEKTDMVAVDRVDTKVERGDEYTGMPTGSWQNQAKAFEDFIIGKTAADIAALDTSNVGPDNPIVAGCTMSSSVPVFQALIAEAAAYERNVTFKTTEAITLGLTIDAKVSGSVANGGKVNADFAAVAMAGDKVVAAMVDSAEAKYALEITEGTDKSGNPTTSLSVTLSEYKGTKNEQGDDYGMGAIGKVEWYAQAQKLADAIVGKTVAEIESVDAAAAGCTMYAGGYIAALVRAAGYVR